MEVHLDLHQEVVIVVGDLLEEVLGVVLLKEVVGDLLEEVLLEGEILEELLEEVLLEVVILEVELWFLVEGHHHLLVFQVVEEVLVVEKYHRRHRRQVQFQYLVFLECIQFLFVQEQSKLILMLIRMW